uniref:Uncharacterized protein n=1 Tax=Arundo donax TaxID=35708 RepID=A0A0A9EL64_ARUDO
MSMGAKCAARVMMTHFKMCCVLAGFLAHFYYVYPDLKVCQYAKRQLFMTCTWHLHEIYFCVSLC